MHVSGITDSRCYKRNTYKFLYILVAYGKKNLYYSLNSTNTKSKNHKLYSFYGDPKSNFNVKLQLKKKKKKKEGFLIEKLLTMAVEIDHIATN